MLGEEDVVPTGSKEEQTVDNFVSVDKINVEDPTEKVNEPEIPYITVEPNEDDIIEIIEEEDPLRLDGFVPNEGKTELLIDDSIINNVVVEIIEGDNPFNKRYPDKGPVTSHQHFLEGNYRYDLPIGRTACHSGEQPKKKRSDPKKWRDIKNRRLRELGQTYTGWTRPSCKDGDNKIVAKRGVERKGRTLGPACDSERCKRSSILQCNLVSESARNEIFNTFWKEMTWDQKKVYVVSLVKNEYPKRRKIDEAYSRRSRTLLYNLRVPSGGETFRVCKRMFMSTLNIGEWSILNWVDRASSIPDYGSQTLEDEDKEVSVKVEETNDV